MKRPEANLAIDLATVRAMGKSGEAREIRQSGPVSLQEIGDTIGVSASTIHSWETGAKVPTGEPARQYLRVLLRIKSLVSGQSR